MLSSVEIAVIHYPEQRGPNWTMFVRAARERGVDLITWEPHRIAVTLSDQTGYVTYDGARVEPAVVIHRTISPFQGIITAAIIQWRRLGVEVLNDIDASFRCRDKLLTTLALQAAGVPFVPTVSFDEPTLTDLATLGPGPLILKPAHGVRGEGIVGYPDAATLIDRLTAAHQGRHRRRAEPGYHLVREHYLAQPLLGGGGKDLRAYVVDGVCLGLMRRYAQPGEIRANLELGATTEPLSLTHPAAARACGLDMCGVDLIEDDDGSPRVLEVDAWAGFAGTSECTGADIAGAILDLALRRARAVKADH
jgi:ribosomal protein S6--L-glutamate ligase